LLAAARKKLFVVNLRSIDVLKLNSTELSSPPQTSRLLPPRKKLFVVNLHSIHPLKLYSTEISLAQLTATERLLAAARKKLFGVILHSIDPVKLNSNYSTWLNSPPQTGRSLPPRKKLFVVNFHSIDPLKLNSTQLSSTHRHKQVACCRQEEALFRQLAQHIPSNSTPLISMYINLAKLTATNRLLAAAKKKLFVVILHSMAPLKAVPTPCMR
jgi:hypothetical protein